jgi:hypothetical protein
MGSKRKADSRASQEEFGRANVTSSVRLSQATAPELTFGDLLIYVNVSLRSGSHANVRRA